MRTGIWAGAVLLLASVIPGALAQDPCDKLAGKTHARPDDALACYKSWPFNETIRQNVLSTVARVFDFFTFEEYHLDPPAPFHEVKVNIRAEIDRINKTVYANDYHFHKDVYDFTNRLKDGHTKYVPTCYRAYQSVLPTPITSLYDAETDEHAIYISPNAVELMTMMGKNYTDYYDSIGFDWKRLAGAKVLSIDDSDPYAHVDWIANTVTGDYLDHGVRVNMVYTSYRIALDVWSQRVGDFAGPIDVSRTDIPMKLLLVNTTEPEDVRVPYYALLIGFQFTNRTNYWALNCAADEGTNGVDFKDFYPLPDPDSRTPQPKPPIRQPIGEMLDPSKQIALDLPEPYIPTIPKTNGSDGAIKGYMLPDNQTGVIYVSSFSPGSFEGFQLDIEASLKDLKSRGATRLLIDTSNNGGGYICLGQFLFAYLTAWKGHAGFVSTIESNYLSRKLFQGLLKYNLDSGWSFYAADNWAFQNETDLPKGYNYLDPPVEVTVNGQQNQISQPIRESESVCNAGWTVGIPNEPVFDLKEVAIVSNGVCGSTCSMFTTLMKERFGTKIAVVGGKPGEPIEYKGMAGNQVLEWFGIDTELKTSDAKPDPLAPPDLLVKANFRHNWRTAYSTIEKDKPIAFRSDPADYRFYYTKDTYVNPQKLWLEASKLLFGSDE